MSAQAAIQARARDFGMDELPGHHEQVIEGQQQELAQFHHHKFLLRRKCRVQGLRPMRAIPRIRARPPLAQGGHRPVVASRQQRARLAGGLQLGSDHGGRAGLLVYGRLHRYRFPRISSARLPWCGSSQSTARRRCGLGTEGSSLGEYDHTGPDS